MIDDDARMEAEAEYALSDAVWELQHGGGFNLSEPSSDRFCPTCGFLYSVHNGDGSCPLMDDERPPIFCD